VIRSEGSDDDRHIVAAAATPRRAVIRRPWARRLQKAGLLLDDVRGYLRPRTHPIDQDQVDAAAFKIEAGVLALYMRLEEIREKEALFLLDAAREERPRRYQNATNPVTNTPKQAQSGRRARRTSTE